MKQKYVSGRRALVALFFEGKAVVAEDGDFDYKIIDNWLRYKPHWRDCYYVASGLSLSVLIKLLKDDNNKWRILE